MCIGKLRDAFWTLGLSDLLTLVYHGDSRLNKKYKNLKVRLLDGKSWMDDQEHLEWNKYVYLSVSKCLSIYIDCWINLSSFSNLFKNRLL